MRHSTAVSPRPLRPRPVFAALASVAVGARVVVGADPPAWVAAIRADLDAEIADRNARTDWS